MLFHDPELKLFDPCLVKFTAQRMFEFHSIEFFDSYRWYIV